MKIFKWILIPIIFLASDSAHAGDQDEDEDRKIVYKQKTEIDFEGLEVEGVLQKPQGALILDRKQASFNPLIKLRTDWNTEIDQSTKDIK